MLYRYRPFRHANEPEEILLENKLWCSQPTSFNDPFDCRPVYTWTDLSVDEQVARAKAMLADRGIPQTSPEGVHLIQRAQADAFNEPEMRAALTFGIQQAISGSSVCCFNRTWQDVPMWAHYGDNHTGYCLGLKFEDGWPEHAIPLEAEYVRDRPRIDLSMDTKRNRAAADQFVRDALLSKSSHWQREDEVRLFRHDVPAGHFEFPPAALRELFFGYKIDPTNRELLMAAVRRRPLPLRVYQLRPHHELYEFEAVPVLIDR
jgi:hypothetical protein